MTRRAALCLRRFAATDGPNPIATMTSSVAADPSRRHRRARSPTENASIEVLGKHATETNRAPHGHPDRCPRSARKVCPTLLVMPELTTTNERNR